MTGSGFGQEQPSTGGPYGSDTSGSQPSPPPYGNGYGPASKDIYAGSPYANDSGSQYSPPQPAYSQGPSQPGYVPGPYNDHGPVRRTNGMAIAALICGIAGFMMVPFASIAAIALGHIGLSSIKRTGEDGRGLALAGLILGYVLTVGVILFIVFLIVIGVAADGGTSTGSFTS